MANYLSGKEFKVAGAKTQDANKGIARMDPSEMRAASLRTGDSVIVTGSKRAAARVLPMFPGERIAGTVQLDRVTRDNAGVTVSDTVTLAREHLNGANLVELGTDGETVVSTRELSRCINGLPLIKGNRLRVNLFGRPPCEYLVEKTEPPGAVIVRPSTRIVLTRGSKSGAKTINSVYYEDIGGLARELQKIREMIELPLKYPELFTRLGIEPPRGVLLHGPPGTGKTLIARAVAHESDACFIHVSGPEIMHKFYGESEGRLRELFEKAKEAAPAILFLDEIDAIAAKRDEVTGEVEKRVVAQLLASMDGIEARGQVIVIGATNIPNALDPALRRPGRFDREIVIGVPRPEDRLEILQIHTRGMPLAPGFDLERMARLTHGFVGADLQALCREAAFNCLREQLPEIDYSLSRLPDDLLLSLEVGETHFLMALREVEPSAIRELLVEVPEVKWDDICGLEEEKRLLREAIGLPLKEPEIYRYYGLEPHKGVLLHGPPGTGKTMLARAVAHETELNFILINGPFLVSKWVGETERSIREVFRKARQVSPCILFFDEIDSLLPHKSNCSDVSSRIVGQFLTEIDGLTELRGVFVLAATNRLELLDPSVTRPGRFDLLIEIPPPGRDARSLIIKRILEHNVYLEHDLNLDLLVDLTENWSGAAVKALCREAVLCALRKRRGYGAPPEHPEKLGLGKTDFAAACRLIKAAAGFDAILTHG